MKTILKLLGIALLLLVVAVAAYHFLRTNHIMTRAQAEEILWTPNSQYVKWNGLDIHVIEQGTGPVVFMVHGLGGNVHNFDKLADLMDEQYRIVRFDLPGFGLSDVPDMPAEDADIRGMYADFLSFMVARYVTDSMVFIGNSLGGWMSWEAAAQHPDTINRLVLIAPAGYDMPEIAAEATGWLKNPVVRFMIAKGLSMDMARSNMWMSTYKDESVPAEMFDLKYAANNKEGNLDWMIKLATNKQFPDTADIAGIEARTLILWGTEDEIIPYSHAARFDRDIPNSTLITYQECGHIPMQEYPEQTARDILNFLATP